jgi:UDP-N-acetylglucosamine:LPS N-acetylglucosamine transferase
VVLEEFNLTPGLLLANLEKVLQPQAREKMSRAASEFIKVDAANIIAEELIYKNR